MKSNHNQSHQYINSIIISHITSQQITHQKHLIVFVKELHTARIEHEQLNLTNVDRVMLTFGLTGFKMIQCQQPQERY